MKKDEKGNYIFENGTEFIEWALIHTKITDNLESLYDYFVTKHNIDPEFFNDYFSDTNENDLELDDNEEFWEYFEQKYVK